jgi:hypothetical protein
MNKVEETGLLAMAIPVWKRGQDAAHYHQSSNDTSQNRMLIYLSVRLDQARAAALVTATQLQRKQGPIHRSIGGNFKIEDTDAFRAMYQIKVHYHIIGNKQHQSDRLQYQRHSFLNVVDCLR